jgi:hypothetical protein
VISEPSASAGVDRGLAKVPGAGASPQKRERENATHRATLRQVWPGGSDSLAGSVM